MLAFFGFKDGAFEAVIPPGGVGIPVDVDFVPVDIELFELVSPLLKIEDDARTTDEGAVSPEIALLLDGRSDLEASAKIPELFCPGMPGFTEIVGTQDSTVDLVSGLWLGI